MKKPGGYLILFTLLAVISSCVSAPTEQTVKTKDYGIYNPSNVSEEDLCTIIIDQYVIINKFDNDNTVEWDITNTEKIVKIGPGIHVFYARYIDRKRIAVADTPVIGQLEKGNTYLLKGVVEDQKIKYHIVLFNNKQEGADVTLDLNKLRGNDSGLLSTYIKYVMNPTMEGNDNSVNLENDEFLLVYKPDMVYTMMDKTTGITTEGRHGFVMDFGMNNGRIYLLETDISKMSRQQFLNESNYQENAQIIMLPIECDGESVTYKYEKPESLIGKEVTFKITEIKK